MVWVLFVGRESELRELNAQLARAERGEGALAILVGEPGIGKTTTIERFTESATSEKRISALWGRCYEGDGAPAFWPWIQILRACCSRLPRAEIAALLGADYGIVATLVPQLAESGIETASTPLPEASDVDGRFQLFDAVSRFLHRCSAEAPLLLVLDDLHGADEPSLLLLRFLGRELRDSRLMVLASCRDSALSRQRPLADTLAELDREPWSSRLELGGLDVPDVGRLAALVAGSDLPNGMVRDLHRRTDGNPFFVTQVVRLASRSTAAELDHEVNPRSVQDAVLRRLDVVSAGGRALLSVASVMGREFDLQVLMTASGAPVGEVLTELGQLVSMRLIGEVADRPGRFRFVHALVPETLYATLDEVVRRDRHGKVGEALRATGSAPLTELAWHYYQAALGGTHRAEAEMFTVLAADRARDLRAYEVAIRHYDMALHLLDAASPRARRCDLTLELAEALSRAGDTPRAQEQFLRAAEIAGGHLPIQLARAALGHAGPTVTGGLVNTVAVELMQHALTALDIAEVGWRARLLARLAMELHFTNQHELREELSAEAVALAREWAEPRALAMVISSRRYATWNPENSARRLTDSLEIVELGEQLGDTEITSQGYRWLIPDLAEQGDAAGLDRAVHRCAVVAESSRQPVYRWYARVFETCHALLRGEFDDAERCATEALELGGRAQAGNAAIYHAAHLFVLRREQDRSAELAPLMLDIIGRFPLPLYECWLTCVLADTGRIDEATARLDALFVHNFAAIRPNALWLGSMATLAEVCVTLGDREHGEAVFAHLWPHRERRAMVGVPVTLGSVSYYLGRLATLAGRYVDARALLDVAAAGDRRMGAHPWLAWTRLAQAELLRAQTGDVVREQELISDARRVGERLGMARLIRLVQGLNARSLPPRSANTSDDLSRREREVLRLVAGGRSNKAIAAELVITVNTVERHLVSIYRKLGVTGRAAAAVHAIRQGELGLPS